jgi:hypothetical protein
VCGCGEVEVDADEDGVCDEVVGQQQPDDPQDAPPAPQDEGDSQNDPASCGVRCGPTGGVTLAAMLVGLMLMRVTPRRRYLR